MNEGINILEETITALCCFIDVPLKKIFWRKSVYPLSLTQKLEKKYFGENLYILCRLPKNLNWA